MKKSLVLVLLLAPASSVFAQMTAPAPDSTHARDTVAATSRTESKPQVVTGDCLSTTMDLLRRTQRNAQSETPWKR
jgi:hypothetical protein